MNQFILPVLKPDPNRRHPKLLVRINTNSDLMLIFWMTCLVVPILSVLVAGWMLFGLGAVMNAFWWTTPMVFIVWFIAFVWGIKSTGQEYARFRNEVVVPPNLDAPDIYFVVNKKGAVTHADPGPYDSSQVTVVRINPYALYDCDAVEVGYPLDFTDQHVVTPWKLKVSFGMGLVSSTYVEKLWRVWQLGISRSLDGKPDVAPFLLYYSQPRGEVLRVECERV